LARPSYRFKFSQRRAFLLQHPEERRMSAEIVGAVAGTAASPFLPKCTLDHGNQCLSAFEASIVKFLRPERQEARGVVRRNGL
jgi:hypothetical protein